jgi:hypothetical protein
VPSEALWAARERRRPQKSPRIRPSQVECDAEEAARTASPRALIEAPLDLGSELGLVETGAKGDHGEMIVVQ